ncbi:hypothetical protein BV898_00746 [Hypsibius exemplaris]|uniref:ZP domain-containing protein n=1 Tax=Hypsibius exemplaris TaxID=2072580 RepID=A0A1W0XEB0_HYPEX|nr:hypothetical protein BV898_00746 [Hypsibius exemplaris]
MRQQVLGIFLLVIGWLTVECKEALNITCKMDATQITVEIFTTRPLYSVQLKNADQTCDPQEFTETSIRFHIQNYQLGRCGFTRADDSPNGIDGTFWNNLSWKEKPSSSKTSNTKVKCAHKLSKILAAQPPPQLFRVPLIIHLPFGAFPSAFNSMMAAGQQPTAGGPPNLEASPSTGSIAGGGFPGPFGPGMVWLRSAGGATPAAGESVPVIQRR